MLEPIKKIFGVMGGEEKSMVFQVGNNNSQQEAPKSPIYQAKNMDLGFSTTHPVMQNTMCEEVLGLEEATEVTQHQSSPTPKTLISQVSSPKKTSSCRKKWKRHARLLWLLNPHKQLSQKRFDKEISIKSLTPAKERLHKVIEVCDVSNPDTPNELEVVPKHPRWTP